MIPIKMIPSAYLLGTQHSGLELGGLDQPIINRPAQLLPQPPQLPPALTTPHPRPLESIELMDLCYLFISHLVADPVEGVFALAEVLHQFLGLQETQALLLGLLQEKVPQSVQLLQTSLKQNGNRNIPIRKYHCSFRSHLKTGNC